MVKTKSPELYEKYVVHTTPTRITQTLRPPQRKTLDANNARWVKQNKQLHPTKGWRKISVKSTLIADITQRVKTGAMPYDPRLWKAIIQRKVFI